MEHTLSKPPRKITDTTEAVCSRCNKVAYREVIVTDYDDEGKAFYTRLVTGGYKQSCDETGIPNGPIIPFCNCGD